MKINVCFKWLHVDPHIRNVESPVAQAFTLLTKWRYSECNGYGKVLKVLSTFTDMRIHSGENSFWMISVLESLPFFPHALKNLRTHTAKELVSIKNEGQPLTMSLTKTLSGWKISKCISTGKIVSYSCLHWHVRTHTGGDPRNAIDVVQSQPRFCRMVTKYTENKMYKYC